MADDVSSRHSGSTTRKPVHHQSIVRSWRSALLSELAATKRQNAPVRQKLLDNTYEVLCGDTTRTKWVGDVDLRKSVPLEVEGEYDAVGRRGEDPETVPYVAAGLDKGGDPCFVARRKQDK